LCPKTAIHTYDEAIRFLDGLDVSAMKLGLERVRRLLETLGNPQESLPMVHIAGTNGKGSVTAMLGSILKSAGYRTGSFISPHLIHVRERIAINGNPILPDDFQAETAALKEHLERLGWPREDWPTYFEFLNVMAYQYFRHQNVDITLFETGLGGRLDSTNVVRQPNLTVITTIGMDHMQHLGDTAEKIAAEKAGILKAGVPLVLGDSMPEEARQVILQSASALEAPVFEMTGGAFEVGADSSPTAGLMLRHIDSGQSYRLGLLGPYQKDNLAIVLGCVAQLREQGFAISEDAAREGLAHARWPVRFQYFKAEHILLDGSHNPDGFQSLQEGLALYFKARPMIWLVSLRANRDLQPLLNVIRQFSEPLAVIVTCSEPVRLYHAPEMLAASIQEAVGAHCPVQVAKAPVEALGLLKLALSRHAACGPLGVVTGSLYTAGGILACLEHGGAIPQAPV
jgi:dihydrofolate synthase/folylpolyglutamate synthase